jgi:hypothetical protein
MGGHLVHAEAFEHFGEQHALHRCVPCPGIWFGFGRFGLVSFVLASFILASLVWVGMGVLGIFAISLTSIFSHLARRVNGALSAGMGALAFRRPALAVSPARALVRPS